MEEKELQINPSQYREEIQLCGIKVAKEQANDYVQQFREYIYDKMNFSKVHNLGVVDGVEQRLILLVQNLQQENYPDQWPKIIVEEIEKRKLELQTNVFQLTLQNYSAFDFLEKVLPKGVQIPTGYETVGHIAHFNLIPEQLPYKYIIGETILTKVKNIKTVVNKLDKLHNVYRTPELEVIAGENNLETKHKEGKFTFCLNFEKVYWCSRLQVERDRVLSIIKSTDTVLDLFCGIGPFSIRAAKMGCNVICNDLNPYCYDYLLINRVENKVASKMLCFNNDARKIVDTLLDAQLVKKYPLNFRHFDHVYMNLPVNNIEFCDVFRGLLKKGDPEIWNIHNLPTIHCTGFVPISSEENCKIAIETRIKKVLPHFTKESILHFQVIKNINPKLLMFCISFPLSVGDAEEQPSSDYSYIKPEREAECLPIIK